MTERTLTGEEARKMVGKLKCKTLRELARLVGVPHAQKKGKGELASETWNRLTEGSSNVDIWTEIRSLRCNTKRGCTQDEFEKKITSIYTRVKSTKNAEYSAKTSELYNKCDIGKSILLIDSQSDAYEFKWNQVHIMVRPNRDVSIEAGQTSRASVEEIKNTMNWVLQRAIRYWDESIYQANKSEDLKLHAQRGTPAVELVLDVWLGGMEIEFSREGLATPIRFSLQLYGQSSNRKTYRILIRNTFQELLRLEGKISTSVDPNNEVETIDTNYVLVEFQTGEVDYGIFLTAKDDWKFRCKGGLYQIFGPGELRSGWSPWMKETFFGFHELPAAELNTITPVQFVTRDLSDGTHLELQNKSDFSLTIIPGSLDRPPPLDGKTTTPQGAELLESSIKLGMDWEDGVATRVYGSYLFPRVLTGLLQARPHYSLQSTEEDCPQGFIRNGAHGCCVYLLQGALETFRLDALEKCVNTECKGLSTEDAAQLRSYLQGVQQGQHELDAYVSSLNLTPAQLKWTVETATTLRQNWLKALGRSFDGMFEEAGLSTSVDACTLDEVVKAEESADEKKQNKKNFWNRSWSESALEAIKRAGNGVAWALQWLWSWAWVILKKTGQVLYWVGSETLKLASRGMQLASWILSDPRRARLILVLVRRLRISMCKRAGLYMIENHWAVPISAAKKEILLKTAANPLSFLEEVTEDVEQLTKSELSAPALTATVFNSNAAQKALGTGGKILKAGFLGLVTGIPFVGPALAVVAEVVADEVGDKLATASKEALEIQRLKTDVEQTLTLLRDILNVSECLEQAGFELTIDWGTIANQLAGESVLSALDTFKRNYILSAPPQDLTSAPLKDDNSET